MTKRLYYEKKKESYDPLVDSKSDYQVFSKYRDLFLLAGQRRRVPLKGKEIIRLLSQEARPNRRDFFMI